MFSFLFLLFCTRTHIHQSLFFTHACFTIIFLSSQKLINIFTVHCFFTVTFLFYFPFLKFFIFIFKMTKFFLFTLSTVAGVGQAFQDSATESDPQEVHLNDFYDDDFLPLPTNFNAKEDTKYNAFIFGNALLHHLKDARTPRNICQSHI